jgi:bifunctional non-homologous end joining protein LigD
MPLPEVWPVIVTKPTESEFLGLLRRLCENPSWLAEEKYDGYRIFLLYDGQALQFVAKKKKTYPLPKSFSPSVLSFLKKCGITSLILDGELMGFDETGQIDFYAIAKNAGARQIFAFDLLYLNGFDYRNKPLLWRKEQLESFVEATKAVGDLFHYVPHTADPMQKAGEVQRIFSGNLEGVIFKHRDSIYGDTRYPWFKFKNKKYTKYPDRAKRFNKRPGKNI